MIYEQNHASIQHPTAAEPLPLCCIFLRPLPPPRAGDVGPFPDGAEA